MAPEQQRGDGDDDGKDGAPAEKPECVDRSKKSRDERGERRVAKEHGDRHPGRHGGEPEPQVEAEEHAGRRGHALAALEAVIQRVQMPDEHRKTRDRHIAAEARRQPHREPALARVADQRKHRGGLLARSQNVGGARVLRAVAAWIGQAHQPAYHHGERDRSQAVRGERADDGHHRDRILPEPIIPPDPWTISSSGISGCRRSSAFIGGSAWCRRRSASIWKSASRTRRYFRATKSPTASTTTRSPRGSGKSPPST